MSFNLNEEKHRLNVCHRLKNDGSVFWALQFSCPSFLVIIILLMAVSFARDPCNIGLGSPYKSCLGE